MSAFPPLPTIRQVDFYKRDELTTDLICCEIQSSDNTFTWHEESKEWPSLLDHLSQLDGFDRDWFAKVSQPPFEECRHTAYLA